MVKFWMCMVDGGNAPTVRHGSREKADAEAERLARTTKRRVVVLEAVGVCAVTDVQWQTLEDPDTVF